MSKVIYLYDENFIFDKEITIEDDIESPTNSTILNPNDFKKEEYDNEDYLLKFDNNFNSWIYVKKDYHDEYIASLIQAKEEGLIRLNERQYNLAISKVKKLLGNSDTTLLRTLELGQIIPQEWVDYRLALRSLLSKTTDDMPIEIPTQPPYPN